MWVTSAYQKPQMASMHCSFEPKVRSGWCTMKRMFPSTTAELPSRHCVAADLSSGQAPQLNIQTIRTSSDPLLYENRFASSILHNVKWPAFFDIQLRNLLSLISIFRLTTGRSSWKNVLKSFSIDNTLRSVFVRVWALQCHLFCRQPWPHL